MRRMNRPTAGEAAEGIFTRKLSATNPFRSTRRLIFASLGLAALIGAGFLLWPAPKITRTLRIGFQNAVPYHFPDANGKPTGPLVEMVGAAAQRRGIDLEWVYFPQGPEKALSDGQ